MGNPAFDPGFSSDAEYRPDAVNFGIFFLLKAGTPDKWVRAWSGTYDFPMPRDLYDTAEDDEDRIYRPVGMPGGLPVFDQVFNGEYVSGEFALSGVDATALRLLGEDRALVNGADIHLGLMDFDSDAQPIGTCDWLGRARAGKPGFRREAGVRGAIYTVSLPFVTGYFDRNQGQFSVHSPESQRRRSPDDAGCDQLPRISVGMILKWPATE